MKYFLTIVLLGCGFVGSTQARNESRVDLAEKIRYNSGMKAIDSLKTALISANENELFEIQFHLFREYLTINKDSSSFYLDMALNRALKIADSANLVSAYNAKGSILRSDGNIVKAIRIYETALAIAKRNKFKKQIKFLLNNLAISYTLIAAYDTALTYNFESLKIREEEGDVRDIYVALNNIGYLYEELGDAENALNYYNMGYDLKIKNNVNYDIDMSLINIARVLNSLGKYNEAELKINQSFVFCTTGECRPENLILAFQVIGESLFNLKQFEEAEYYFNKSLELSIKYEITRIGGSSIDSKSFCYYWLALIKFNEGKPGEAMNYLNDSQLVAEKAGLQAQILKNYSLYSKIYFAEKNYKMAFEYQSRFQQLNAEILNIDVLKKISKIQSEYSARESAAKMKSQEKIMRLQEETISQHKTLNYLIGIVAFLIFGLMLIFYWMNRQKQGINLILDQRVRDRTIELEKNRDELKHAHDEQAMVLRRVSIELTSSLASLKGLVYLAMRDLPHEHAVYFEDAVINSKRISEYVKNHTPVE